MKDVRVLEIKESVFADNERQADELRRVKKRRCVSDESNVFARIWKDNYIERNN